MATKKVGTTGRFGAKYGRRTKNLVRDIELVSKATHVCQRCQAEAVKKVSTGVWSCKHCGAKFAGGAYAPTQQSITIKKEAKPVSVEEYEAETVQKIQKAEAPKASNKEEK